MKAIIAKNNLNYIGINNELPWKCSADLKHFKDLTLGCKLLVGYNTSLKLPPIKNREVIVDSRHVIDTTNIDWCIGGSKTYEKYCHLFTELHISIINDETIGDTLYPTLVNLNPDCKIFYYHFEVNQ
jgi:dihydrofolate reductase